MDQLIQTLKQLAKQHPLEKCFRWELPESNPLPVPLDLASIFERNIYLKHNFYDLLSSGDLAGRYWLIQEWGGIRSFKKNDKNDLLLHKFESELKKGALTRSTFSVISSLSKVASFVDHQTYAIYDSRVIYSLNWLLFKHTELREFYPQPIGRNADINQYELNTIFNLVDGNVVYKSHRIAYHDYCQLMKKLSIEVYAKSEPYWAEMLLFILAPEYIVEDIKRSLSISLEC
ncbi:hypothetical protein L313_2898 [Acinetobacter haemolyticus CIP 64.3 = MTCC 9819]|uniref:Uncharacterized protein n=2 Tax=Acinetobacter haemolyticus TaxID=29430 RepID=A0A6B2BBJ5_ACIHA|nr:hypothetical protein [Acinetobacter haemolyticus]ENW19595.1 hypothetical protein F927_01012 [Acinetobacter haemolyticus CIP 64.3 = MTCC 9819]ENW21042.1 hypothetical protein F926_01817 [Acinetobacter haemolyticus NIPH 261]EPR87994.1 hypothetical protein L313_2898 [Acinetobacter haemolyticus CIP 64.3 = MTCC 9819]NAR98301.1 hypothetical protein [Acinetobacter haemolyticus]QHI09988.1 hypothetical protein AhaeAN59_07665 [Acinetobacter haemolyticus]